MRAIPFLMLTVVGNGIWQTLVSWESRLSSWGYDPLFCSVQTRIGLDSLAFILRDQTTVIVGPSGVGKSSLINALRNNNRAADAVEGDNWFDPVCLIILPILSLCWFCWLIC